MNPTCLGLRIGSMTLLLLVTLAPTTSFGQSWLARITGINVDVPNRTIEIKPPDIQAVPGMVQNLPKDVGQALLNPAAPALALAIRESKAQAIRRGVQPIPPSVKQQLLPYFPPGFLDKVRWTTAGGISIDGALANWFNQEGAVTLDDVVVFSSAGLANNVELWAHEITHVLQYNQLSIDTFAFQYSINWSGLESQASQNASRIAQSINSVGNGGQRSWAYSGQVASPSQQLTWQSMNRAAQAAIPAKDCIWINNQNNTTGNKCPVSIMVSGVIVQRFGDGYTFTMPCNERTCLIPAGQSGPLISPYGHVIIGVTAAYEVR